MGIGDCLLAMGEARAMHEKTKQPVAIVDPRGRIVKDHGLSEGIPYILRRPTSARTYLRLINAPGARPYIAAKSPTKWTWKPYKPIPAEIKFTDGELEFAQRYAGRVMIESNVKDIGHTNKAWHRWPALMTALRAEGIQTFQCGPGGTPWIADDFLLTPTFRYAAAALSKASAFVGTEGGLGHAAAAVGVPSVIIFGGFISPEVTGYEMHRNLFTGSGLGCGMRTDCRHCREAMDKITVDEVVRNLKELLK